MLRYLVMRLLGVVPTLLLLVLAVVLLVRIIPGNIVNVALADQGQVSKSQRAALERNLGLSKPVWSQYVDYIKGIATGSLGNSLWSHQPVKNMIAGRFWVSIQLALMAMLAAVGVAVPAGVIAGLRANSSSDYVVRIVAVLGLSVPSFVVATYVLLVPTILWGWSVPLYVASKGQLWAHYRSLAIPAAILAFELAASLTRVTRTAVMETMRQEYIRTARSKGLREAVVVLRHMLKNSLVPVVSIAGLQLAALFSGVVIIEQIFGIPGLGSLTISAFSTRDYTLIQGITLVLGVVVCLVNLGVDLSYPLLDPRVSL